MEYIGIALSAVSLILLIVLLLRKQSAIDMNQVASVVQREVQQQMILEKEDLLKSVNALHSTNMEAINNIGNALYRNQQQSSKAQTDRFHDFEGKINQQIAAQSDSTTKQIAAFQDVLTDQNDAFRKQTADQMQQMEQRIGTLQQQTAQSLETMRNSMSDNMAQMRTENNQKLDEIRGTVDEKLQTTLEKRIAESFKTVSDQLEQVYKGLGEMQTLASDVGGLKKVLSGVKTRGILGEIQLGAILEEILSPEQYEVNVATIPNSRERVEFAIKLPADNGTIYLPIDSKFPGDRYAQLLEAQESGDKTAVDAAYKALETVIKSEAKDIRDKYVEVPYTTNFGIMFLPFEGLYAEVVNRGLVEVLQRDFKVNVAGPSTMAALLNSLQMGFRTLAIQKRSNEVWEVLGAVKTEFEKFEKTMSAMQKHLNATSKDLEDLMGTRTRAINRKLRTVQQLDEIQASQVLTLSLGDSEE